MKPKQLDSLMRGAAAHHIAKHIDAKVRTLPGVLASGDVHSTAEAMVARWGDDGVRIFLALVESDSFTTHAALAKATGAKKSAVEGFWSVTMRNARVLVRRDGSPEPFELDLFAHKKERFFSHRGKNDLGEVHEGGVILLLCTASPMYGEAMTIAATTEAGTAALRNNYEGAIERAERTTRKEKTDREKLRASLDVARAAGAVQSDLFPKTGTDGAE